MDKKAQKLGQNGIGNVTAGLDMCMINSETDVSLS